MTWSILARDGDGTFGVAIASRFFAVGALCVHSRHAAGVLSTQALMNPLYGRAGIERLAQGESAAEVVDALTSADGGRDHRQFHVLDARGLPAAFTGAACIDWCGHRIEDDFSVAGNMLSGPAVLDETARVFRQARGRPLAERLLAAMAAGQAAGGDKRGQQAAALRIHGLRGISFPGSAGRRSCSAARRTGATLPRQPGALPVVRRLPAATQRPRRPHRSQPDRGAHRATSCVGAVAAESGSA